MKAFLIEELYVLIQVFQDDFGMPGDTLILALFLINSSQRHPNCRTSVCSICTALACSTCRIRLKSYWRRHWTHSCWKRISWYCLVLIFWLSSRFYRACINVHLESLQFCDMLQRRAEWRCFELFLSDFSAAWTLHFTESLVTRSKDPSG